MLKAPGIKGINKKCNILKRFHEVECYYIYREKNWNLYFNVS